MTESWYFWLDGTRDPAVNMALDEALLRTAPERGRPLLRLYGWSAPAVSIGLLQKFSPDLAPGRPVVRRPTGGGLVDHARDITYTVVAPPTHSLYGLPTAESHRLLHGAVTAALRIAGIAADLAPCCGPNDRNVCFAGPVQYDVVVAGQSRRRSPAAAQARFVAQGSILLPPTAIVSGKPPAFDGALRLGFERELGVVFEPFQPPPALFGLAEQLCSEKYRTREWTERCRA